MRLSLACTFLILTHGVVAHGAESTPLSQSPITANLVTGDVTNKTALELVSCDCDADVSGCCEAPIGCCDNLGYCQSGCCGKCFKWGEDTHLTVGGGIRFSYNSIEGGNPLGGRKQDFNVNNARLYFNGQGHKRIGFELNTDINNAQGFDIHGSGFGSLDEGEMRILDAIVKFQLTDNIHLWAGRMLPPSDRSNLSGPFYANIWNFPFVQFGYANIFQGRDDGAALWGQYGDGAFKWQIGAFEGEATGGPTFVGHPATDKLMFSARAVVNFLDPEPGYYNSSTYYGEKDILAIGASVMHRPDALLAGANTVDYTAWNIDALFETKLANDGVISVEGAYYNIDDNDGLIGGAAVTNPPSGLARQGTSYFVLAGYLFPREFCIFDYPGKFQVVGRYQSYDHDAVGAAAAGTSDATDVQLNYIMFGHNARISGVWTHLDTPSAANVDTFTLGTQLQF